MDWECKPPEGKTFATMGQREIVDHVCVHGNGDDAALHPEGYCWHYERMPLGKFMGLVWPGETEPLTHARCMAIIGDFTEMQHDRVYCGSIPVTWDTFARAWMEAADPQPLIITFEPDGEGTFIWDGVHRFAVAYLHKLETVPVFVGTVVE
jgi:hypothetical protein